jgi:hypothetical protein
MHSAGIADLAKSTMKRWVERKLEERRNLGVKGKSRVLASKATHAAFLRQSEVSGNVTHGSSESIAAVTDAGYSIKRQVLINHPQIACRIRPRRLPLRCQPKPMWRGKGLACVSC